MSSSRCFNNLATVTTLLLVVAVSTPAFAQSRVGRQWITTGLSVSPTVLTDSNGAAYGASNTVIGGGLRLRLGFQHVIANPFVMAAELELGNQYFPDATLSPDGYSAAGGGFAWQAGLVGRWTPLGERSGPAVGLGLHTFRASLPDTPVQSLAGELRLGWYFWGERNFALAEIGYAAPLLEGLDIPNSYGLDDDPVEKTWSMHRFMFGFSFGF